VIASLAMIGLPLLNNFVGEFLILSSTFSGVSRSWAIAASLGVILGAAYMLMLVQRLFYGPESELARLTPADDLHFRELAVLWPLAVLMLVMGLAPSIWLTSLERIGHIPQLKSLAASPGFVLPSSPSTASSQREDQR